MKWIIFLCAFSVSKSIGNNIFFYYQRTYRRKQNHRWKIHRWSISVDDFVGKLIINRMIVQIPIENSAVNLKIVVVNVEGWDWKKNQLKREKRRSKSTDLIRDSSYKIMITPLKENKKKIMKLHYQST